MLKETEKVKSSYDDVPMNSPEYLKRYQTSFNPMFSANCVKQEASAVSGDLQVLQGPASSSYLISSSGYKSIGGSYYNVGGGSGSSCYFGYGYGIELI